MSFNTHPLQVIRKKSYANSYLILRSGMYWNCWNLHWIFRQNKQDTSPRIRVFPPKTQLRAREARVQMIEIALYNFDTLKREI